MIKQSIHQGDVALLNVFVANNHTSKQKKQKAVELQEETDILTIIDRFQHSSFNNS